MMPVGTSVFTDGVEWYFARIAWRMNDRFEWTRNIKMSPKIDVTAAGGWALLARWFAVSFHEAVTTPFEQTGMAVVKWRRVGGQEWELADMFGAGTRSTVTRWRLEADSVIVKFIAAGATQDRATKVAGYFAHERAMLQTLAQVPSIVHAHPTFARVDSVFTALEDCGDSLAHLNIRGAAGQALAKIVFKDIWCGALAALKAANLCHFDITEHNIAINFDCTKAKLIDLESCTTIGDATPSIPTATTDVPNRPARATAVFDEQAVCAILKCLWLLEVSSFAKRKSFFNEFAADDVRLHLVSAIATSSSLLTL
jgi:serine/threonine protein kinase